MYEGPRKGHHSSSGMYYFLLKVMKFISFVEMKDHKD